MADIEVETEKETGLPTEVKPDAVRRKSIFERAVERSAPDDTETETRTPETGEQEPGIIFEPVEHQPYIISYVCVLIPRFDTHFLSGDVVADLHECMDHLATSFSWKLEWLDVQRDYMQWLMKVPVAFAPAQFIRIIRHTTSLKILTDYPRYKRENFSRDFWAPGHLINVGRRPHPLETIHEFIRLTRKQQGIYSPHR